MMQILNVPINWTRELKSIVMNPFTKQSGPNLPENFNGTTVTPKGYFSLFLTEEVISKIYTNSNFYHKHYVALKSAVNPQYHDKSWD